MTPGLVPLLLALTLVFFFAQWLLNAYLRWVSDEPETPKRHPP